MVYNTITNLCHCYQPLEQLVPKTVRINPFIVIIKSMLLVIDSHTFGCLSFRNYLFVFSIFLAQIFTESRGSFWHLFVFSLDLRSHYIFFRPTFRTCRCL